jgi:hypothetical protein
MNGIMQDQAKGGVDVETKLHIFVNRRKFGVERGVKEIMTGSELAALVNVPAENAVVRQDSGANKHEIGINESTTVKMGDHFLVTRRTVEGGCVA